MPMPRSKPELVLMVFLGDGPAPVLDDEILMRVGQQLPTGCLIFQEVYDGDFCNMLAEYGPSHIIAAFEEGQEDRLCQLSNILLSSRYCAKLLVCILPSCTPPEKLAGPDDPERDIWGRKVPAPLIN